MTEIKEAKMEESKIQEKWNENVEPCLGCGIQWKKIGKSCPVCYAPSQLLRERYSLPIQLKR